MLAREALRDLKVERKASCIKLGRYCTVRGGISMTIRRNVGHSSAEALTVAIDVGSSRQSVVNWEARAAKTLVSETQAVYRDSFDLCKRSVRSFCVHTWRGDATNSAVCQDNNAQNLEVMSSFFFQLGAPLDFDVASKPISELLPEHTSAAELQIVKDGSGAGCYATVHKQLKGLGGEPFGETTSSSTSVVWCGTTDAGPD